MIDQSIQIGWLNWILYCYTKKDILGFYGFGIFLYYVAHFQTALSHLLFIRFSIIKC